MVVFILAVKYKKNLANSITFPLPEVEFVTKLMATSLHLLNLIKTATVNSIATLLYVHRLSAQKNIQESAGSKTTQQKRSVNNEERFYQDSTTHCGVANVVSLSATAIKTATDERTL